MSPKANIFVNAFSGHDLNYQEEESEHIEDMDFNESEQYELYEDYRQSQKNMSIEKADDYI